MRLLIWNIYSFVEVYDWRSRSNSAVMNGEYLRHNLFQLIYRSNMGSS